MRLVTIARVFTNLISFLTTSNPNQRISVIQRRKVLYVFRFPWLEFDYFAVDVGMTTTTVEKDYYKATEDYR